MDDTDRIKTGCNTFLNTDSRCAQWFQEAKQFIPYCTSKANLYMKPHPLCIQSGSGCRATDLEGIERLDCINSFTALIHGHAFPPVVKAITEQVARGTNFSFATPAELALANYYMWKGRYTKATEYLEAAIALVGANRKAY